MQCTIAEAVGAELILHIFVEGLAHSLTQFNVIGTETFKTSVLIRIVETSDNIT